MPKSVGLATGYIDPTTGEVTPTGVPLGAQKYCAGARCGYHQFLQGTSMAAAHVTGVVALINSRYGEGRLPPVLVEAVLDRTAAPHACPTPPLVGYADEGRSPEFDAPCAGTTSVNGCYRHGIVDSAAAVGIRR